MAYTDSSTMGATVDVMGYSCRFPESETPMQFWENLVSGRDMVTENARRWPVGLHETPKRFGKLVEYHLFDAPFFSVHGKQAQKMDPQMRKLLEVSYEAWIDSGVDYKALKGDPKVGVYLGVCGSEVHALWLGDVRNITGYEQTGCTMSMLANRLSFFYGFKGPSKAVDTACSSAFMALNDAVVDMQRGRIDYAIVGGSSALFRPATSLAFLRLKMLSPDGACKSFDASANGYARAEGVACIILKRSDVVDVPWIMPRDPYCSIIGIGTNNDGHTEQGITFPSGEAQHQLGTEVCRACDINPADVVYVEAHGTGTVVGDAQELMAIDRLYGSGAGRTAEDPLLIGSVKSNMGHCEGASGMAGLIKVMLSYEHGQLPGNLHFNEPNPNNESLKSGIIRVVNGTTPWQGGLVAISSFGFGGSNVHCLIAGRVKPQTEGLLSLRPTQPQLMGETIIEEVVEEVAIDPELIIPIAARTQEGAQKLIDMIKARGADAPTLAIPLKRFANAARNDPHKLGYRATICNGQSKWENANVGAPPAIWFVFSGNGSQWPKMAVTLLGSSSTFRRSVTACAAALKPYNIDLMGEFTAENGWSKPGLAMVGLVAVQIGLVDVLREDYGITPAGMLGHSAGEIACGYADGCLTQKQTILLGYHRGRMAPDHGVTGGLMAAVGLSAEAADARIKAAGLTRTVVGCDNSATGVTLAGPEEELKPLCQRLKDENVFVREVDTLGIAYHSPALEPFSAVLAKELEALLPNPKPRSKTWLSTSYPLDSADPQAGICGPDYHVTSYKSRVLFKGACEQIPKDAVVLEIGPHSIMRSALRQNCSGVPYVAMMKKDDDAVLSVREAVAGLWRKGASLQWSTPSRLDDIPELPRDMREALVSWNHSADYEVPTYKDYSDHMGGGQWEKTYDLGGAHKFLVDHNIDGRILMPATSYVVTAWEALAVKEGKSISEVPVTFDDVCIHQAVPAEADQKVTLGVLLAPGNRFHVMHGGDLICDGIIKPIRQAPAPKEAEPAQEASLTTEAGQVAAPQEGVREAAGAEPVDPNDFRIAAGGTATATVTLSSPLKLGKSCEIIPASPNGIANSARPDFVKAKEFFSKAAASSPLSKTPLVDKTVEKLPDEAVAQDKEAIAAAAEGAVPEDVPIDDGSEAWPFNVEETIGKEPFYRTIGRTGIQYGPDFRMVWRVNTADTDAQMRWDQCWIRLLDGMLQLSVADTKDHQLRIPVRIRHIAINNAEGTSAQWVACKMDRIMSTVTNELATITGLELILAPRRATALDHKTDVQMAQFVPYGTNVDTDMERLHYIKQLLGFCQSRMMPVLTSWFEHHGTQLPPHLEAIKEMCRKRTDKCPEGDELDKFFNDPEHCFARLARDISAPDIVHKNMESPLQAIVQHPEHEHMYQIDPACRSFNTTVLSTLLGVVLENMGPGFRAIEVGCGTGGLTKDAVPILEKDGNAELLQYCATDVTPAFGPALIDSLRSPKVAFKVWDINSPPPEELGPAFDLLVATNVLHTAKNLADMLKNVHAAIADNGFLCFFEMTCSLPTLCWGLDAQCWQFTDEREFGLWVGIEKWEELLATAGFTPVMVHKDKIDSSAFFLYRKLPTKPLAPPELISGPPVEATEESMSAWLEEYRVKLSDVHGIKNEVKDGADGPTNGTAVAALTSAPEGEEKVKAPEKRLWVHGSLSSAPGTIGFFRTAKTEPLGNRLRLIFKADPVIGPATGLPESREEFSKEIQQVEGLDLTQNVFINGVWGHYRMFDVPLKEAESRSVDQSPYGAHMEIANYGDLNSLYWAENEKPDHPDMILVGVTYGALNFKDVMLAYGKLNRDQMANGYCGSKLGFEFSGTLPSPGGERRVMGVARDAIATHTWGLPYLLWDIPASWSLKDAATVPVAYLTAYYALVMRGGMVKQSKVLIHSGTGAVGLAAIRICLQRGVEVFTTCGSDKKRSYLLKTFPKLRDDHIGDSRSCSFEAMVMKQTGGRGVDLALNALADDKLHATVRCLAPNGSLLEIGKFDILKGSGISMRPMHHNISFQGINLDSLFLGYQKEQVWEMHRLLNEGIASGEVQPLPWTVFARSKAQDAFRYLAGGTHMGKVLIQCADTEGPLLHSGPPSTAPEAAEEGKDIVPASPTPIIDPEIRVKAVFTAEPQRSYLITGGLGGFGLALAVWLSTKGARQIIISSKRGLRTGEQHKVVAKLNEMGVNITISMLDIANVDEARQLVGLAEDQAPLAIIFHLAMVLDDRLLMKQDGVSWNRCVRPKALGAWNLDLASRGLAHLEDFVCFSSVVSTVGHQGQANYGYANGAIDFLCEARRQAGLPSQSIQWGPIADVGFVAENMSLMSKVNTRLFELSMPQPIDECLKYLGDLLCADRKLVRPVVSVLAKKLASKTVEEDDGRGLVEQVMDLLGIKEGEIGDNENLSGMGIDSMQVVEVRARIQRALGRPFPLEEIGTLTLGKLRELEKEAGLGPSSKKNSAAADSGPDDIPEEPTDQGVSEPLLPKSDANASAPSMQSSGDPSLNQTRERWDSAAGAVGTSKRDVVVDVMNGQKETLVSIPCATRDSVAQDKGPARPLWKTLQWLLLSSIGILYIAAVLCLAAWPVVHFIVQLATMYSKWIVLPVLPAAWLVFGFLLMLQTCISKRLFSPFIAPHRSIEMFTVDFLGWWLVQRLVAVTNLLFADNLRGTPFLVWWFRALGARIGKGVYIDSLDFTDLELVNIGDGTVVNEGVSIVGHYFKDGFLHFGQILIGKNVRLDPFCVVQPGSKIEDGTALETLQKSKSALLAVKKDPFAFMKSRGARSMGGKAAPAGDLSREIKSWGMSKCVASICQLAVLYTEGIVVALAAYLGYLVLAHLLEAVGFWTNMSGYEAGYVVTAVLALLSPLYVAVIPIMAQTLVPAAGAWPVYFARAATAYGVFGVLFAFVVAYAAYGFALAAAAVLIKWILVGRVKAGVHKRCSIYGVKLWASQRFIEQAVRKFVMHAMGTWLFCVWLRALGAKIGSYVTVRFGNALTVPDMLLIGDGVHIGDTANLVTSYAVDVDHTMTGAIIIEPQVIIGFMAAVMPGSKLGKGLLLSALSSTEAGQELPGGRLCMGAPAYALTKHDFGQVVKPLGMFQMAFYGVLPFAQYFWTMFIMAIALYAAAYASAELLNSQPYVAPLLLEPLLLTGLAVALLGLVACSKWIIQGRIRPGSFRKFNGTYQRRSMAANALVGIGNNGMMEMAKGSSYHNLFLWVAGARLGRDVYVDNSGFMDFDLAAFGNGVVVGRSANIFCHVGVYRGGDLVIEQSPSDFGFNSIVGTRAVTVTGFQLAPRSQLSTLELGLKVGEGLPV